MFDMDDDYKSLSIFIVFLFTTIIVFIVTVGWYFAKKNQQISDAIASGANPIAVGCALDNYSSNSNACNLAK